jgi:hypothetical protein
METNPRIQGEWAPPPPIATPPPLPPLKPTPTSEEEFDGLLGNLVEHYSALPPPAFGESPVAAEEQTDISPVRVGPPAWVWVVASVVVVGIAAGVLFLTGVVNLQMLGLGEQIAQTPAPAPPALSAEDVAKGVKIRVASPRAVPLPATEPLASSATDVEPAAPEKPGAAGGSSTKEKATTNKPPVAAVKVRARKARPHRVAKRTTRHRRSGRRVASRRKPSRRRVADDWTDPYQ